MAIGHAESPLQKNPPRPAGERGSPPKGTRTFGAGHLLKENKQKRKKKELVIVPWLGAERNNWRSGRQIKNANL